MKIDEHSPERAKRLKRWQRNRDHTDGVDSVKEAKTRYLPRHSSMDADDYDAHLAATEYFPAAARTLESHLGLVFRKPAKLIAPPAIEAIGEVITAEAQSLEQLARWAFREFSITNDGGILIDHPEAPEGLSIAASLALDLRPFAARYAAEAILELTYGVIGGRKRLTKVRLQDDGNTIRQLELIDSVYTVSIFRKSESEWVLAKTFEPKANAQPLNQIPFTYLGDDEVGANFDDLCSVNQTHFLHASKLEMALLWLARPKPWVAGIDDDIDLDIAPGAIWRFENSEVKIGMLQLDSAGLAALENQLERLNKSMQQLGLRMLQSEKAPAEAAETVARRQASENSILAASARHVSERLTSALRVMASWMGIGETVNYSLNTDFIPAVIDASLLGQLVGLNQAGKLTDRELFDALQRGEIIDEAVSYEQHAAELETLQIDVPIGE